jgi:gamma-glutamylputrescine oxidase
MDPFDDNRSAWTADKPPYTAEPPLAGAVDADVAIIGGGFTGVSTALHLAERYPERRIVLLEAKELGNGASGRNGGMVLNWVNGVEHDDPAHARRVFDVTRGGIDQIEAMIARWAPGTSFRRDGTWEVRTSAARADEAAAHAEWLQAAGIPVRWVPAAELPAQLRLAGAHGALFDPTAGQLDGVDFLRRLKPSLLAMGVHLYEGTRVTAIREGSTHTLTTSAGSVRANAIVLATNAYTPKLGYFRSGVLPLHSHVIGTEPLSPERQAAIGWRAGAGFSDDLDRIAYASLSPTGRIVFGGGSNTSYGYRYGGHTRWEGLADAGFSAVHKRMLTYLPDAADVAITHRWTGTLGVTLSRVCTMGVMGEHRNVYYALGYSGHGVTLANLAGRVLADLYGGEHDRWKDLPFYQQKLLYIPPDPLRWLGYHAYTSVTGRSPRRKL